VDLHQDRIAGIRVVRGAPCGATWEVAERLKGTPLGDAAIRAGLETQYFCKANPAGWDPIYGKSPVHFAGEIHSKALKKALTFATGRHRTERGPGGR